MSLFNLIKHKTNLPHSAVLLVCAILFTVCNVLFLRVFRNLIYELLHTSYSAFTKRYITRTIDVSLFYKFDYNNFIRFLNVIFRKENEYKTPVETLE